MRNALTTFQTDAHAPAHSAAKRAMAAIFVVLCVCAFAIPAAAHDYAYQNNAYDSDHAEVYAAYPYRQDDPAYGSQPANAYPNDSYRTGTGYDSRQYPGAYSQDYAIVPGQPRHDRDHGYSAYGHDGYGYSAYEHRLYDDEGRDSQAAPYDPDGMVSI